jgi:hypothetical protein
MKQDERDMLITLVSDVGHIKEKTDGLEKKLDAQIEKSSTYVNKKVWMWLTGVLFSLILGAYTFGYQVDTQAREHGENYKIHKIEKGK